MKTLTRMQKSTSCTGKMVHGILFTAAGLQNRQDSSCTKRFQHKRIKFRFKNTYRVNVIMLGGKKHHLNLNRNTLTPKNYIFFQQMIFNFVKYLSKQEEKDTKINNIMN